MVALAGLGAAVGAVGASSISIVGSINVGSIMNGLSQMGKGLGKVKDTAKSSFGDIKRLGSPIGKIGVGLLGVATAAAAATMGIAAMSPTVAPILAKMGVEFGKLTRILGKELKPVFEAVSEVFSGFVSWIGSEEGRGVIQSVVGTFQSLYTVLKDVWAWLEDTGVIATVIQFFTDLHTTLQDALDGIHKVFTGEISLEDLVAGFFEWTGNMGNMVVAWVGYMAGSLIKAVSEIDWGSLISNTINGVISGNQAIMEWAGGIGDIFATGVMQGYRGEAFVAPVNETAAAHETVRSEKREDSYTLQARHSNTGGG